MNIQELVGLYKNWHKYTRISMNIQESVGIYKELAGIQSTLSTVTPYISTPSS